MMTAEEREPLTGRFGEKAERVVWQSYYWRHSCTWINTEEPRYDLYNK